MKDRLRFQADSVADTSDADIDEDELEGKSQVGEQAEPERFEKKDDWDLAIRFRDIQRYGYLDPKEKLTMSEAAIQSVVDRARESLGPIQKPYRYHFFTESELAARNQPNAVQELDIEETLFRHHDRELVFQVREEKDHGMVFLLDTSLSMKGEKLALLAVTVAAVFESVPSRTLAIYGFDSEIHVIKEFGETLSTPQVVERVLSIPPGGFTNIDLGLRHARLAIEGSSFPNARVVIVSDGRYTEGKDPVFEGKSLKFIYPVKIGKDPGGRAVMKDLADTGMGRFLEVREMSDLPQFLLRAVRTWVK